VMLPNTPPEYAGVTGDLQAPPAGAGMARAKAHRGGAGAVAGRIRHKVEIIAAQQAGGVPRTVTVSIGVALLTAEMLDASALLRAADAALYEAKHSGKNSVVVAG
jgi:diguanylate cyclase (GGDEF)-like protein